MTQPTAHLSVDVDRAAELAAARARMYAAPHIAGRATLDAVVAGMPLPSARRWPRYLAMKARRQQEPITLAEAVEQCRTARAGRTEA